MNASVEEVTGPTWEITLGPAEPSETAWRARLLERVRPLLEDRLRESPDLREVTLPAGPLLLHARHRTGRFQAGNHLRLLCAPDMPSLVTQAGPHTLPSDLTCQMLPDPALAQLAKRLVGVESIAEQVLLWLTCAWDGRAEHWSACTGIPLSPGFVRHLEERAAAFVFVGDPGLGKSAVAATIADRYCRMIGIAGRILWLRATVRGGGLVGEFSKHLQAAFEYLRSLPYEELKCLIIDEADTVAMRRSETQAHHEDRCGTSLLLQALDALAGIPRLLVIMTGNLEEHIDQAVRRRATVLRFARPDLVARATLLARWLPHLALHDLSRAARAADGMSPADMERALERAFLSAIAQNSPVTASLATDCLRQGRRTRSV